MLACPPQWLATKCWHVHPQWLATKCWHVHPQWLATKCWHVHPQWLATKCWHVHPQWLATKCWHVHSLFPKFVAVTNAKTRTSIMRNAQQSWLLCLFDKMYLMQVRTVCQKLQHVTSWNLSMHVMFGFVIHERNTEKTIFSSNVKVNTGPTVSDGWLPDL